MNKTRVHVYLGNNAKRVQKAAKKRGIPMSKYVQAVNRQLLWNRLVYLHKI